MSKRRKSNTKPVVTDEPTYEEILDSLEEEIEDDEDVEEVVKKKPKKKWSRKKKITVGIVAGISAIGAAFLGGMVTENRRKKRADSWKTFNYSDGEITTNDPEVRGYLEEHPGETVSDAEKNLEEEGIL